MAEAQRAQRTIGEVVTVPEQRYYGAAILDEIVGQLEKEAARIGADFAQELVERREKYVAAQD